MTAGTTDIVQTFLLDDGSVRGRLVRLGPALDSILAGHDYPTSVAKVLAESLALGAALAGALKFDGVFTLQIQSDGPLSLVVADVTSKGAMRGYARYDAERLADDTAVLGQGYLALTIDQGPDTDRYQGIVELDETGIEETAVHYFEQSEQLATGFMLAARAPSNENGANGQGWQAAALMVQRMPEDPADGIASTDEADEDFNRAAILMETVKETELFDLNLPSQGLLYRLFHAEGLILHEPQPLRAQCRCSQERVASTLISFPRDEIETLRDEAGDVVVTCEFCRTSYVFSGGDLDRLYAP